MRTNATPKQTKTTKISKKDQRSKTPSSGWTGGHLTLNHVARKLIFELDFQLWHSLVWVPPKLGYTVMQHRFTFLSHHAHLMFNTGFALKFGCPASQCYWPSFMSSTSESEPKSNVE
eukprot:4219052-Amphidinium_carterae.1